jgi:hypothetical protein
MVLFCRCLRLWDHVLEAIVGCCWEPPHLQLRNVTEKNNEGRGRPPLTSISKQEYQKLLIPMWDWQIKNRMKCGGIAELLERREYWLPETNESDFLRYIDHLKRREGQIEKGLDAGCRTLLSRATMARDRKSVV